MNKEKQQLHLHLIKTENKKISNETSTRLVEKQFSSVQSFYSVVRTE
jgi:hypothetical protein